VAVGWVLHEEHYDFFASDCSGVGHFDRDGVHDVPKGWVSALVASCCGNGMRCRGIPGGIVVCTGFLDVLRIVDIWVD